MHLDMQSNSGIYMMLGEGTTYSGSYKLKLNTKVQVLKDYAMGQILCTRHFLVAQGIMYLRQPYTKIIRA